MNGEAPEFRFQAIGVLRSGGGEYRQQAPRQGALWRNFGMVELYPGRGFETAAADLSGADYVWLIYVFDRNRTWKPKVMPPVGRRRIGVFATRSPHRPNPVGLSAVRLLGVEGLRLYIADHDLLNGTAILDIKPYLRDVDSFPEARLGWRDALNFSGRRLEFSPEAEAQLELLSALGAPDLRMVAESQLALRELDERRQRLNRSSNGNRVLAFRTWRLEFTAEESVIRVERIYSGYTPDELSAGTPDPYRDKDIHREYLERFFPQP